MKEGDIVSVRAFIHLVAGEPDGDYHIQISDNKDSMAKCFIVEVPKDDEEFTKSATVRSHAKTVRAFVRDKL